jgi:hypothetical protein
MLRRPPGAGRNRTPLFGPPSLGLIDATSNEGSFGSDCECPTIGTDALTTAAKTIPLANIRPMLRGRLDSTRVE